MKKIRAYRRYKAVTKMSARMQTLRRRYGSDDWFDNPGRLKSNSCIPRCNCSWCTDNRIKKFTISEEDEKLIREITNQKHPTK